MKLLFLDFDGVLHPIGPAVSRTGEFCHVERFEAVMREFADWDIVISSSWREIFPVAELKGFFSADIAARIVGATPELGWGQQRGREVRVFAQEIGCTRFVAIDDMPDLFDVDDKSFLVVCQPDVGLDDAAADRLREALR